MKDIVKTAEQKLKLIKDFVANVESGKWVKK